MNDPQRAFRWWQHFDIRAIGWWWCDWYSVTAFLSTFCAICTIICSWEKWVSAIHCHHIDHIMVKPKARIPSWECSLVKGDPRKDAEPVQCLDGSLSNHSLLTISTVIYTFQDFCTVKITIATSISSALQPPVFGTFFLTFITMYALTETHPSYTQPQQLHIELNPHAFATHILIE